MTISQRADEAIKRFEDLIGGDFQTNSEHVLIHCDYCKAQIITFIRSELLSLAKSMQAEHDRELDEEIRNRDYNEEMADKLAYKIASLIRPGEDWIDVIGEHSSMNNPWERALELKSLLKKEQEQS